MKIRTIKKILIANRGEIAIRIMRTCRELGIRTVAVFSDADRDAPHVRFADESIHIGASPASQSYLVHDRIILAASDSGADAIHPGYGFLSENHVFARKVKEANISFIGPPHQAMKRLGDKTQARKLARDNGVPITKGTVDPVTSIEQLRKVVRSIGFPVLLKAAGGGGGKGMKIVRQEEELESAYRSARSEAESAFADSRVYVEQYVANPRHIEVQVLADTYGNIVHLGERECSIQRRHQKIVEETPSPAVSPDLRKKITKAAVTLIGKAGYHNAATVEFLLDEAGKFYFLEVNTRLQVEHPVTEMCTGIDLVREQIRIAEGKPLRIKQRDIISRGSAIECRIYAEDPLNSFFPSTGTIRHLSQCDGPFVRVDRGVEQGQEITPFYDPLLMKIIAWGASRNDAVVRMGRSLQELRIYGVAHNAGLCSWVVTHPAFISGKFSTTFLEHHFHGEKSLSGESDDLTIAALAAALFHHTTNEVPGTVISGNPSGNWKSDRMRSLR